MHRQHETNPHFLPHQQPPQPRAHPLPSQQHPEPQADPARSRRQKRAQQHPESQAGPEPAHSRQHPERRPLPSQQYPEPQADPARSRRQPRAHSFPSQQHPEPQAGPDPAHSRQQPERRVQFVPSPEHASQEHPEPPAHPGGSSPQHFRRWTDPFQQPGLRVIEPRKTKPLTWFTAVFCVIFWVVVIVGGLVVLVVYMLFRPRSPRFDISSVTLNAAYLDMGYLLNADVTVLANFTNPNKKVHVDFSYLVVNLYYEDTLIASRAIYPFSVASRQTMFADVHMVTSQVQLPMKDSQKLTEQIQNNGIEFQIKGYFRTRSNLGSFLRYSYWLYGKCRIVVTAPPSGVLVSRSCRTKR
ncbi:hypothetical protein PVL29_000667 [Vitis rotundifolia]|uniref:Late embryogenesis abundant protein LEA-2 subgroup domain-containing protein n=1 Tax=Vitis rotundifolia TaxID=103349 RepID=A0AA39AM48_VITRO|nr:hypothetical protein PVL29_000667 [Vitis rotundifolia]